MAEILIVDDDKLICDILVKMMKRIGHTSRYALTGKNGLEMAGIGMFDIVFLDVKLPDADGLDLIQAIKSVPSSPEVIIITGESDPDRAQMAINSGAWNYLEKPFLKQELHLQVSRALEFRKERGKVSTPGVFKRNGIVGESKQIKSCIDKASIASYSGTSVLISGAPGTGKELFAKSIHLNSDRSENNFVIVDCSAINEQVVENVLFGYKKGVVKGALTDKAGLVTFADNGTLFLDEVSGFPLKTQKMLVQVMETLRFTPVGGTQKKESNFRVIATSSKDLDTLSTQGKFRQDLLSRLKGVHIKLPSVRQMDEDIVRLAIHYINQFCERYKIDTKGVSPEFLDILTAYEWPGNVREMVNAMGKAVASAKNEPTLYSIHLQSRVKEKLLKETLIPHGVKGQMNPGDILHGKFPLLKELMDNTENDYFEALLTHTNGNIKEISRISGISISGVYARIKKYRLNSKKI